MSRPLEPDLCVIGAGSGGLAVAAGGAQMGAKVVLIERGLMGGDCLNFGCVPSKSLLAAAHLAALARRGTALGIVSGPSQINFAAAAATIGTFRRTDAAIDALHDLLMRIGAKSGVGFQVARVVLERPMADHA